MPDVETAAETARNWVSWGQAAGLGEHCTQPVLMTGAMLPQQQLPSISRFRSTRL